MTLPRGRHLRRLIVAIFMAGALIGVGAGWRTLGVAWKIRAGQKALAVGDAAAALKHFLAAERLDPRHALTQFLLGRTYRRLGNAEETASRLQQARDCGFPVQRLEREWILTRAQAGLLAQTEPALYKLLTSAGEDGPEICSAFVSGYVQNYEFEKARQILEAWIGDYPNDPEPRIALGKISLHWANLPEAEKQFRLALKLCPAYRGAVDLLGETLVEQKKYQEALPLLQNDDRQDDSAAQHRLLVAQCLLNLGREAESLEIYADIVSQFPENCAALLGLGKAKTWAGQFQEALVDLDRALDLCPRNLDVRYARVQALSLRGDQSRTQTELREISTARASLAKAGELASEILKHPDKLDARVEIGTTLIEYGDRAEGVAWLLSVLQYQPDHQEAHRLLADYYEKEGDHDQAERHRLALKPR
ncbi:MAG: tetratricopeptide repeat protein [Planctomycetaceae bacterium]|nr:tetratricopeptide repeat protein [Planctomycetaceae bacterium]